MKPTPTVFHSTLIKFRVLDTVSVIRLQCSEKTLQNVENPELNQMIKLAQSIANQNIPTNGQGCS